MKYLYRQGCLHGLQCATAVHWTGVHLSAQSLLWDVQLRIRELRAPGGAGLRSARGLGAASLVRKECCDEL